MIEIGNRARNQPAPPPAVYESLAEPNRDPNRQWLDLLDDEQWPTIIKGEHPRVITWTSLWPRRPDAVIHFALTPDGGGTQLRWTLLVDEPRPDDSLVGHMRKRVNELINAGLRYSYGQ